MLLARWLLCLSLFASTVSLAQTPSISAPPLISAPEQAEDAAPQEEVPPGDESIASADEGDAPRMPAAARIPLEVMGGAAAGTLAGLLALGASELLFDDCADNPVCISIFLIAAPGAMLLGTPLGVYVTGRLTGGRGLYWPALAGMGVGAAAGLVMLAAFSNVSEALQIASIVTLPVAGAVVGYEISHALRTPDTAGLAGANTAGPSPHIIPLVGVTPRGGLFGGLAGRF